MQEHYVAPALQLVGGTSEVVLGSARVGWDLMGEMMPPGKEFDTDDPPAING